MLEAQHLSFIHPGSNEPVLNDVTFHIKAGSTTLICGGNGAGKSTLLRLIAGLLRPSSGSIAFADPAFGTNSQHGGCSLLMQEADYQILGSTVLEDMLLPWAKPSGELMEKARKLAEIAGLEGCLNTPPSQLSYGQKRRLCIASAMMADPELLLMDEPSTGLDYAGCNLLAETISALREKGMTIMLATHDPALFMPILDENDNVMILSQGHLCGFFSKSNAVYAINKHPEWNVRPCL
ncbi:MAG: ABC transporter ATP-binding protein [Mailhella sp.]|nr:ABC transporter ATP-binding protein [Mailhella sp.]